MNLFVIGYFGRNNLGDETILEVFLEWAQRNFDAPDFRVLSTSPEETEKRHIARAVNRTDVWSIISAIRWCDAVVAPGGGLLQDTTSARSVLYYTWLMRAAQAMRKPVYMLSQGIGPLARPWTRRCSARALAGCRMVTVRDEKSAAVLEGAHPGFQKPHRSADMVFMLGELLAAPAAQPGKPVVGAVSAGNKPLLKIGISLRPAPGLERTAGALAGSLLRLAEDYRVSLNLFAFDAGEDSGPVNRFAAEIRRRAPGMELILSGELKDRPPGAADTMNEIAGMDVFIGMRLHSLVFSALAGTPFVALPYDPKVSAFAGICGQPAVKDLASASPMEIHTIVVGLLKKTRAENAAGLEAARRAETVRLAESMSGFRAELNNLPARPGIKIQGVPVSGLSLPGTVRKILETVRRGDRLHVVTVNPEMIMRARSEPEFGSLLAKSTMNTPDGVGVRVAARLKYRRTMEPVTGVDITGLLLNVSRRRKLKIFMLGGRPEIIAEVEKKMAAHPARPLLCGTHHGYLSDVDPVELAKKINDSGADVVLVGMGVPAQEYWIRDNAEAAGASVYMGVGGVFDVLSGKTARAPGLFRKTGMEWLWRVAGDPKRIRRLASFPYFILLALFEAVRGRGRD